MPTAFAGAQPRFAPSSSLEDSLRQGYERATSFSPIKKDERNKVFKEYGLKAGVSKGKSDSAIEGLATKSVISWFKKQQAAKKQAAKKQAAVKAPKPAAKAAPRRTTTKLAPRPVTKPAAPKPAGVDPKYVSRVMAQHGFKTTPPAYALVSKEAFDAWIARAVRQLPPTNPLRIAPKAPAPKKKPTSTRDAHYSSGEMGGRGGMLM